MPVLAPRATVLAPVAVQSAVPAGVKATDSPLSGTAAPLLSRSVAVSVTLWPGPTLEVAGSRRSPASQGE